ncbi:reverse transcriptase domain-containing protein [Tanacetum coccineum]
MAPKRATRSNIAPETTNTTSVTNAQLQAMINQGVTATLAAHDANTNGVDSHNSGTGARRNERATRECTLPYFMKCQPLNFKGTEGVVDTLYDIAYAMTWTKLKKKITDKYCPRTEIKKLEVKLWELKVKVRCDRVTTKTFSELALREVECFAEESDKNEKYVDENKRKPDNNQQPQQHHQNKRQNTGRAYAAGTVEKKPYGGSKPLCSKCNYHHDGPSKVYAVGHAGTNPDSNVMTGTFLLNNRYASILFDTGADRSFVSTAFSSQIDITPTALDHYYDVELADGSIFGV